MKIIFFVMFCITQVYAGKNANNEPYFDALSFSRIMYAISQGRGVSVEDAQYAQSAILTQPCAQWILDQKDSSPPAAPQAETDEDFQNLLKTLDNAMIDSSQSLFEKTLQIQESLQQEQDTLRKLGFISPPATFQSEVKRFSSLCGRRAKKP